MSIMLGDPKVQLGLIFFFFLLASFVIIDCPKYGHIECIINTEVADHVQDEAVNKILKYYSNEAIIDFEEIC